MSDPASQQRFEVGEVALLQSIQSAPSWNGREVIIVSPLELVRAIDYDTGERVIAYHYSVTAPWLPQLPREWSFNPSQLRKKPPKVQTCRWEQCEWQPGSITA